MKNIKLKIDPKKIIDEIIIMLQLFLVFVGGMDFAAVSQFIGLDFGIVPTM
jgi:hypothetical protein